MLAETSETGSSAKVTEPRDDAEPGQDKPGAPTTKRIRDTWNLAGLVLAAALLILAAYSGGSLAPPSPENEALSLIDPRAYTSRLEGTTWLAPGLTHEIFRR